MKTICITIGLIGFGIGVGTVGTSDLGLHIIPDAQFYGQAVLSFVLILLGTVGYSTCPNQEVVNHGNIHKAKNPTVKRLYRQAYHRANSTHIVPHY
ncbi:MAG: hypothetical protein RSD74_01255 [Angelakisella sp.]